MEWIKRRQYIEGRREFKAGLGNAEGVITKEYKEYYDSIKEIAESVWKELEGANIYEKEYREYMAYKLADNGFEVVQEKREKIDGWEKVYLDISAGEKENRTVFELKRHERKEGIEQLMKYMEGVKLEMGFLICFLKSKVKVYMVYKKEEERAGESAGEYYWYDGSKLYRGSKR